MVRFILCMFALALSMSASSQITYTHEDSVLVYAMQANDQQKVMEMIEKEAYSDASLSSVSQFYSMIGDYPRALEFGKLDSAYKQELLGEEDPIYASSLANLSLSYKYIGKFDEAQYLIMKSLGIIENSKGKSSLEYAHGLGDLAGFYHDMGEFEKALPRYLESLDIMEKNGGTNHMNYGSVMNNLGLLYNIMGQQEMALAMYEKTLSFIERVIGKEDSRYASTLNNLGLIYHDLENFPKAIELYSQARQHFAKSIGTEHPTYAKTLDNLAISYDNMGDTESALPLVKESVAIFAKTLGKQHPEYATSIHTLGGMHLRNGEYDQALPLIEESLQIVEKNFGPGNPDYANKLNSLASLHVKRKDGEQAVSTYLRLNENLRQQIFNLFHLLDDKSQFATQARLKLFFDAISTFEYIINRENTGLNKAQFNNQLLRKGLIQGNQKQLLQSLRSHPDSSIRAEYGLWETNQRMLAREYLKPITARRPDFDSLEQVVNRQELFLSNQSSDFREARELITWEDIDEKLEQNEAVIEFAHFSHRVEKEGQIVDSVRYVAYILRKNSLHPQFVYLFDEGEIGNLEQNNPMMREAYLDQLYAASDRGIKPKTAQPASAPSSPKSLYQLIWEPMDSLLQGIERIYVSPSGLLHRINLSTIAINNRQILGDQYQIFTIGSSRSLLHKDDLQTRANKTASLWGGIRYDSDTMLPSTSHPWEYLSGSQVEVETLSDQLEGAGYSIDLFEGDEATETRFCQLGKAERSPHILHIATHGYFFPDPKETIGIEEAERGKLPPVQLSEHPMVRSGLILAGANQSWGGESSLSAEADGILTAYEISQLDLSETELVVLSACETGLGDIQGNEGVYGLQRAFKIAGAKYVLMSLWQVPDKETQELMNTFYKEWLGGLDIREAFQSAQNKMRKRHKDPYFWAGFVLIE